MSNAGSALEKTNGTKNAEIKRLQMSELYSLSYNTTMTYFKNTRRINSLREKTLPNLTVWHLDTAVHQGQHSRFTSYKYYESKKTEEIRGENAQSIGLDFST